MSKLIFHNFYWNCYRGIGTTDQGKYERSDEHGRQILIQSEEN